MTDLRTAAQQALEALEDLADCGAEAWSEQRPCVQIGREAITAIRAALAEPVQEPDLSRCPQCGGPADNGHDRSIPPSPYFCTKCMAEHYCDTYCTWADHAPGCVMEERNFCPRCGKRTNDIHTCTPPAPLTDEVIADLWHQNGGFHHHFARAIERWLRGHA